MSNSRGRRRTARRDAPRRPPVTGAESRPALEPASDRPPRLDLGLKIAGTVVAVLLAALAGVYGTFLTPFRVGTVLVPVSLLIAVGGIIAAVWIAYQVSGNKYIAMLPCLAWLVVAFISSVPTSDGDVLLLGTNWVAYGHLLVGLTTAAACAYRLFL